jgi:hypothetical protein
LTTFYHLATVREWDAGKAAGAYTTSTRGRTLEQQGFLHGSRWSRGRTASSRSSPRLPPGRRVGWDPSADMITAGAVTIGRWRSAAVSALRALPLVVLTAPAGLALPLAGRLVVLRQPRDAIQNRV